MTDARAGFTLIELIVVMTILAALALGLVLSSGAGGMIARSHDDDPHKLAQELTAAVADARDAALIGYQPHGLSPRVDGWLVLRRQDAAWREVQYLRSDASLTWRVADALLPPPVFPLHEVPEPEILFLTDGRTTPFSAEISLSGKNILCATNGWDALECTAR